MKTIRFLIGSLVLMVGTSGCISIKKTSEFNKNSGITKNTRHVRLGSKKEGFFGAPILYARKKYVTQSGNLLRIERSTLALKRSGQKRLRNKIINYKDGKKIRVISNVRGKRRVKHFDEEEEVPPTEQEEQSTLEE